MACPTADIGGRVDLVAVNVDTQEFDIESCALTDDQIARQNEFLSNMFQTVKSGAEEPRLGFISCAPSVKVVINLRRRPTADVDADSRPRVPAKQAKPPRDECIKEAMASLMCNDARNKKIVLVSNCNDDRAVSDA